MSCEKSKSDFSKHNFEDEYTREKVQRPTIEQGGEANAETSAGKHGMLLRNNPDRTVLRGTINGEWIY
jgi:hypothetical protein